jgi:hypothetical protein
VYKRHGTEVKRCSFERCSNDFIGVGCTLKNKRFVFIISEGCTTNVKNKRLVQIKKTGVCICPDLAVSPL